MRIRFVSFPAGIALALVCAAVNPASAQYHSYNVASGSDCIMQDYRMVNAPWGIYDADHSNVDGVLPAGESLN